MFQKQPAQKDFYSQLLNGISSLSIASSGAPSSSSSSTPSLENRILEIKGIQELTPEDVAGYKFNTGFDKSVFLLATPESKGEFQKLSAEECIQRGDIEMNKPYKGKDDDGEAELYYQAAIRKGLAVGKYKLACFYLKQLQEEMQECKEEMQKDITQIESVVTTEYAPAAFYWLNEYLESGDQNPSLKSEAIQKREALLKNKDYEKLFHIFLLLKAYLTQPEYSHKPDKSREFGECVRKVGENFLQLVKKPSSIQNPVSQSQASVLAGQQGSSSSSSSSYFPARRIVVAKRASVKDNRFRPY